MQGVRTAEANAVDRAPENKGLELRRGAVEAKDLRRRGLTRQALAKAEALIEAYPDAPDGWAQAGNAFLDLKMRERAMAALAKAVALDPASTPHARQLAKVVLKREGMRLRDSIGEVMQFFAEVGFRPSTIIDVGINTGTPGLYEFFPDTRILMVDPLAESVPFMEHVVSVYPGAVFECCAAGAEEAEMTLNVSPAYGGSSLADVVGDRKDSVSRKVPVRRIDELVRKHQMTGPFVLKVDTEGSELEVVSGAAGILDEVEVMIMETPIRPTSTGRDLAAVTERLASLGFVPYDFIDRNYNDWDGTLKQFDLVCVRRDGFFRTAEGYRKLAAPKRIRKQDIIDAKLSKRQKMAESLGLESDTPHDQ